MELIKSVSRRSVVSEVVYIVLNIAYASTLLLLVNLFDPPYIAYVVVVLSKWRTIAVRMRFWLANLQTNLADMLVGLSIVTLLWLHSGSLWIQIGITLLFIVWLIAIKPRSKQKWIMVQAGTVQFLGLMALFSFSYALPLPLVVMIAWLVGYVSAQHLLGSYNDEVDRVFIAVIWGFCVAELAWIAYYWTIAYSPLMIPQISIVATLLSFLVYMAYQSYQTNDGIIKRKDMTMPVFFVVGTIVLLAVVFNGLDPTSL